MHEGGGGQKTTGKTSVERKSLNNSLLEWTFRGIIQGIMHHVVICSSSVD